MAEATNPITTASNPRVREDAVDSLAETMWQAASRSGESIVVSQRALCVMVRAVLASAPSPEAGGDLPADLQAAYDAGFKASGEGWNGEYPEDVMREGGYKDGRSDWINGYIFDVVAARSVIRSGKLVASTGSGEETKGEPASPSGSQASPEAPSDPRPVGFDPSRAWQDISTAPNDDRLILAGCPACEQFPEGRVMIWRASMLNRNQKGPTPQHLSFPATHWAPLLPAPAAGGRPESYRSEYRLAAWLVSFAQKQLDENRDWHARNRLRWAAEALIGEDAVLALAGEAAQAAETQSGSVHEHAAPQGATP